MSRDVKSDQTETTTASTPRHSEPINDAHNVMNQSNIMLCYNGDGLSNTDIEQHKNIEDVVVENSNFHPAECFSPKCDSLLCGEQISMTQKQVEVGSRAQDLECEIQRCRSIQNRSIFVVGYARSGTTITAEILNTNRDVYILGEANFFAKNDCERFRDWYNEQHVRFNNQTTKTCYAPNFLPEGAHTWWQWLGEACTLHTFVGDKMALSYEQFKNTPPEDIRGFFEARFYTSKYIFLIRNPIQTILSSTKILNIKNDAEVTQQIVGWLTYLKMWCDWIRTFPNTITLVTDVLDGNHVRAISDFTGIDLLGAELLLDDRCRRIHSLPTEHVSLSYSREELLKIYELAKCALMLERAEWQAEQKRSLLANNTVSNLNAAKSVVPRELGQVWAMANDLIERLMATL